MSSGVARYSTTDEFGVVCHFSRAEKRRLLLIGKDRSMQRGPMTSIVVRRIASMLAVTYYAVRVHGINTNHILPPMCRPVSRRCRSGGFAGPSMVGRLLNGGYPFSFAVIALSLYASP